MTTLFHFAAPVKPARPFGRGVLASRPTYRAEYTAAEWAWYCEDSRRREDARFDRMAEESAAADRLEAGLCC